MQTLILKKRTKTGLLISDKVDFSTRNLPGLKKILCNDKGVSSPRNINILNVYGPLTNLQNICSKI